MTRRTIRTQIATTAAAIFLIAALTACSSAPPPTLPPIDFAAAAAVDDSNSPDSSATAAEAAAVPGAAQSVNANAADPGSPVQPRYPAMDPTLPSTISVYAVGSTQAEPDQAVITFAVADTSPSVELARNETARLAEAIASAAREAGIAPSDVATTNFSIYADYDWNNNVRYLRGYTVTHSMAITIRRIDDAGATIDAVSAAAGDSLEFHSISFGHQDSTALASTARADAVTQAHQVAGELAAASHRWLGPLLSLTEGQVPFAAPAYLNTRADTLSSSAAYPTSVSPSVSDIAIAVHATFALE